MLNRLLIGRTLLLLLMAIASVLTPGRTQCHVVTIFGLKTGDCNKQNVKVIPRTLDRDLQVVRFDDNRLTRLEPDEFRIYPNLQEIYLARNHIESISEKAFHGLFSLQILDLEGNQLPSIPSDSFQQISSLRMLSLKGNPIRRIEMESLMSLRNVEELNFENCWLDAIDRWAFRGLDKLVEINLVNNELIGLDPEMSLPTTLSVLRLYRNPWTCNCRLRWLRKWIAGPTSINWDFATNTPTCAAPELIKGVAWKHLLPDQFACPSRIVFNDTRTSATVEEGHNVTLECLAIGDPEPSVSWLRDGEKALPRSTIFVENRGVTESGEKRVASIVTMLRVGLDQAGDYRCSAENSAGRSEMTYKIVVQELGASAVGSGRLDADRETLLGVIVGIGVLVVVVAVVTLCRVKFRQCKKRGYDDEDIFAKNLTPLTKKKKDTTEEDEADSDEEEEEEQDDSSFADSFNFQAKTMGNVKAADSTLQSLLGGKKSNGAVDVLSSRTEDFSGRETRGVHAQHHHHHRRQKEKQRNRPEEEDDDDVEVSSRSYKNSSSATKRNRRPSVMFDEVSPSSSASEKSDPSSPRSDSDHDKSTPDLLSGGGCAGGVGGINGGGGGGIVLQRPVSRLQEIGQHVTRSDRSVSFCAIPKESRPKDERTNRLSFHREASSSAETLVIDDVTRRTATSDSHAKREELMEREKVPVGLTSSGKLSPTAVHFPTVDRPKASEKTSIGLPSKVSLSCNTVHFPEYSSSSQVELIKSSVEGGYSSLGKSCLRKKPPLEFAPNDITQAASGSRGRNFADATSDVKRPKIDEGRRREEHQRLLPRIPPVAVSFRDGSQRVRSSEAVENGPISDSPRRTGAGPHRDHSRNGVETGSMRGSPGRIGGFMHDSLRWIEGSLQRMVEVGLPETLTTNCSSVDRDPLSGCQNSLLEANSTISPPCSSSSKPIRETNRAFPTKPFDTLPTVACSDRGQSSNRPDCSIEDFAASDRLSHRTSCINQNYNQPTKLKKHPYLIPQQQQHHVTLLSDILLSPFGKESVTSSSNASDIRTKSDNRRNIVLDDDDDDAGTAL